VEFKDSGGTFSVAGMLTQIIQGMHWSSVDLWVKQGFISCSVQVLVGIFESRVTNGAI